MEGHRAVVVVYARVGARYETPATNGLSHLVEHMIFRGSRRYPDATAYAEAIERIGGTLYAETGIDYSLYQVSIPPSEVEGAIELLGDVFCGPRFADLAVEKQIIREEILEDLDESGCDINVDNLARATAWPKHPLGFRIIGTLQNLERFTVEDIRAHFERFYGARNLIVCVAGAVKRERVRQAALRAFRDLPAGKPSRSMPPRRARTVRVATVHSVGSQTAIEVLAQALSESDPDYPALICLMRVLDDGLSTRLHRRIVDELGLAYSISAGLEAFVDTGALEISAQVAHENVPRIVSEILALFEELRTRPITAAELDKAKHRYRWDLEASKDDPEAMAGWYGGGALFGRAVSLKRRLCQVMAVKPTDIYRVARRVLTGKRLTIAAVGDLRKGRLAKLKRIAHAYL